MNKYIKIIGIFIIILILMILNNKEYIECNHLNIITEIKIKCSNTFEVTYVETIPKRDDSGIIYKKETYQETNNNLKAAIKKIEKNKKIYKDKAKIKLINCKEKEEFIKNLLDLYSYESYQKK